MWVRVPSAAIFFMCFRWSSNSYLWIGSLKTEIFNSIKYTFSVLWILVALYWWPFASLDWYSATTRGFSFVRKSTTSFSYDSTWAAGGDHINFLDLNISMHTPSISSIFTVNLLITRILPFMAPLFHMWLINTWCTMINRTYHFCSITTSRLQ